jgi:hypothetical protein
VILVLGFALGICIGEASTRYMVCQYTTFINGELKTKNTLCLQYPHVKQGKVATMAPTETEIIWPTATLDEWQPWGTVTPEQTSEPYIPPEETQPPYPGSDWLDWWR